MKKLISTLLAAVMIIGLIPIISSAAETQVPDGYVGVYTIEDLYAIRYALDKDYILMADIDMTEATAEGGDWDNGYGWAPIGENESLPFTGVFDGNGHTIKGMQIRGIKTKYAGLFGYAKDSEFKNLKLDNVAVTTSTATQYAGSLVGYIVDSKISNIKTSGSVNLSSSYQYAYCGGVVGEASNTTIDNCANHASVYSYSSYIISYSNKRGYSYSGGIAGSSNSVISLCCNFATIESAGDYSANSGGIVAKNWGSVINSYNCGEVNSSGYDYAGGIALGGGSVSYCINIGKVSGGYCSAISDGTNSNCYYLVGTAPSGKIWTTDTATTTVALSAAQMKLKSVYGYLDFENVWFIDLATGVEHPQLISNPEIDPDHEHSYSTSVTAPTCSQKGYTTYTCECGHSYADNYTDKTEHTLELRNAVEPTETTSGYSGDYVCLACEETVSTGRVIPATGHVHTYTQWATAIEADCTSNGLDYSVCDGCSVVSFKKTDALGHKDENNDSLCDTCGSSLAQACEHEYKITISDSTCTQKGTVTMTCSLCNNKVTAEIPAKEHNYVDFVVAPTCEKEGFTRHICSLCGDEHSDTAVPANGHKIRVKTITPTCTQNGCDLHVCSECGYNYFDNEVLAKGHTPKKVNEVKPINGKDGYTGDIVCEVCEELLEKGEVTHSHGLNSVTLSDITLNYKKSTTLKPQITADDGVSYTVTYSSSDPKVASVDDNGNIKANKKGSAQITVTVTDELGNTVTDTCNVKVNYSFGQWLIVILLFGWIWY